MNWITQSTFTWVFCTQVEECHAHQSDRRSNGQRSNEAKKKPNEASETDHDFKQGGDHYGALYLKREQKKILKLKVIRELISSSWSRREMNFVLHIASTCNAGGYRSKNTFRVAMQHNCEISCEKMLPTLFRLTFY